MKAATTSLVKALGAHNQILVPMLKEPHFFSSINSNQSSRIDRDSYLDLYKNAVHTSIDASTWYLYDPESSSLIYAHNQSAKIIAILRHPVDRAFSHWQYLSRDGRCPHPSFSEAVKQEIKMIEGGNLVHKYPYVAMGLYSLHLRRFYNAFPEDQIRVYLFDDLRDNPSDVLMDIQCFLGVRVEDLQVQRDVNVSGIPSSRILHEFLNKPSLLRKLLKAFLPSQTTRRKIIQNLNRGNLKRETISMDTSRVLSNFYESDINELEELIGRSLSCWKRS